MASWLLWLDTTLFRAVHQGLWGTPLATLLAGVQHLGEAWGLVPVVAALVLATAKGERLRVAVRISLSILLAAGVTLVLKKLVLAPRPGMYVPELMRRWDDLLEKNVRSWPSGHTTAAFALATAVLALPRSPGRGRAWIAVKAVLLVLAGLTGLARVTVGAHWPTDVVAGAVVGSAMAFATARVWDRLAARRGASAATAPEPSPS